MTRKPKQVICFILDKSGSMETIQDQAISGFNEYINTLKAQNVDANFTLTLFDTQSIDTPYDNISLRNVHALNKDIYRPNAGTPLYDAVVETVEKLEDRVSKIKGKAAVSVVIMTDGEENSSRKHNEKCLRDLVDKLTKKGNWTFAYMGANQDAWSNAARFGIGMGNTLSWNSTIKGTNIAFNALASSSAQWMMRSASGVESSLSTKNFFDNEIKDGDKNA
jgi:hypothetical protein